MRVMTMALMMGLLAGTVHAEDVTATAQMLDKDGKSVGTVKLTQMAQGVVMQIDLQGLKPGWHGIHIHAIGKCDPPAFTSAGGHFNPNNRKHGFGSEGAHAGDMSNIEADSTGHVAAEMMNNRIALINDTPGAFILGQNGTAVVVHATRDDLMTDPTGNSGDRIACGVIAK